MDSARSRIDSTRSRMDSARSRCSALSAPSTSAPILPPKREPKLTSTPLLPESHVTSNADLLSKAVDAQEEPRGRLYSGKTAEEADYIHDPWNMGQRGGIEDPTDIGDSSQRSGWMLLGGRWLRDAPASKLNGSMGDAQTSEEGHANNAGMAAGADAGAGTGIGDAPPETAKASPGAVGTPLLDSSSGSQKQAAALALRQAICAGFKLQPPLLTNSKPATEQQAAKVWPRLNVGAAPLAALDDEADEQKRLLEEWENTVGAIRAEAGGGCSLEVDSVSPSPTKPEDEGAGPSRLELLERRLREAEEREHMLTAQNARLRLAAAFVATAP